MWVKTIALALKVLNKRRKSNSCVGCFDKSNCWKKIVFNFLYGFNFQPSKPGKFGKASSNAIEARSQEKIFGGPEIVENYNQWLSLHVHDNFYSTVQ